MSFSIKTLLRQVESLSDTLEGVSKYKLELNTNLTLTVRISYRACRTIHSRDLKRLFWIYIHHFDDELRELMHFNKLDEDKYAFLNDWHDISHFQEEILRIYRLIYREYPEKLI